MQAHSSQLAACLTCAVRPHAAVAAQQVQQRSSASLSSGTRHLSRTRLLAPPCAHMLPTTPTHPLSLPPHPTLSHGHTKESNRADPGVELSGAKERQVVVAQVHRLVLKDLHGLLCRYIAVRDASYLNPKP